MDRQDFLLFKVLWKILTFVIWSRAWIVYAVAFAAHMAGSSIWGAEAAALGFDETEWMQVSAGAYLFFFIPTMLASIYVYGFWLRGFIRWSKKDPTWTYFGRSKGLKGKGGVNALASVKPAAQVTSDAPAGVVFGKAGRKWVVRAENGSQHVLIFGAPGTSKSQSIALPTLSVWRGGAFVIDIKGELWQEVGRHQPNAVRFAVEDEGALGFDPFATVKADPKKRHDVARNIALTLVPDNPQEKDPYWTQQAQNMLTAGLLTGMMEGFTFIQTMDVVCTSGGVGLVDWIAECGDRMATTYNASFISMDSDKTLGSIYSTLHGKVAVFSVDQDVRECFSREKTITPADLRNGAKIYLCLPESKLEQWKNITSMLAKLFLHDAETWPNNRVEKTLFLVDEMPRLGKLPAITNSLATLRSKGVCIVLITQSLAQLRVLYGRDETDAIVDLCAMKAILSASGDTAELCSKLVGESIQQLASTGRNAQMFDPLKQGRNKGMSEQWHAIMQPSDFQYLGDELVLIEPSSGALKVSKMPFWKNKKNYIKLN